MSVNEGKGEHNETKKIIGINKNSGAKYLLNRRLLPRLLLTKILKYRHMDLFAVFSNESLTGGRHKRSCNVLLTNYTMFLDFSLG